MAKMTRRDFCVTAVAAAPLLAALPVGGAAVATGTKRWYKGNLHCHTYWSDGRAFPDQSVKDYLDAGYDFCAITDHNRMGEDRNVWKKVDPVEKGWPPTISQKNFDLYRQAFASAESRIVNGETQVRLPTLTELIERYSKQGKFLLMRGAEITRCDADWQRHMHMNYINLDQPLPTFASAGLIQGMPRGMTSSQQIRTARGEIRNLAQKLGNPAYLVFLNHPHWRYYDLVPQDVIDNPEVRFFEVCNTGSDFAPVGFLPTDGLYCDRFWDAVNAVRAKAGQPLLLAVANDDCHFYPSTHSPYAKNFGDAFTMVRAEALTPKALFAAMERSDSYASCGVLLEDIAFDGKTLSVSVPATPGVAYTVNFIVTKVSADTSVQQTVHVEGVGTPNRGGRPERTIPVYSKEVGRIVKSDVGQKGEAVKTAYTLAADDLYVRARVESDVKAQYYEYGDHHGHPLVKMAWTQPYTNLSKRSR